MSDPANSLRDTLRALNAEIPSDEAENEGWPQRAMPAMLEALGLAEVPDFGWFVAATSPLYDKAEPAGWRYCHDADHPDGPDLLGVAFAGPPPTVYLRADMSLPQTIRTPGHELWHVREFTRRDPRDEKAADEFGDHAAARFLASLYHP